MRRPPTPLALSSTEARNRRVEIRGRSSTKSCDARAERTVSPTRRSGARADETDVVLWRFAARRSADLQRCRDVAGRDHATCDLGGPRSDRDDSHRARCTDGSDVFRIAGQHHDVVVRETLHGGTDVCVSHTLHDSGDDDARSDVGRRCIEFSISDPEAIQRCRTWPRPIPACLDPNRCRYDRVDRAPTPTTVDCALQMGHHHPVLRVRRLGEGLDRLVVEEDRPHADNASCASAHSNTSSPSASG